MSVQSDRRVSAGGGLRAMHGARRTRSLLQMALALETLAATIRGLALGDEPTPATLQQQLDSVCTIVQAELAESAHGDTWPRHIREVHILHDIRREFDSIKWSMTANECMPSWNELGPPTATAAADAVNRLVSHVQRLHEARQAAVDDMRARLDLRDSMACAALRRLQALRNSGVAVLPPPHFAPPAASAVEGYWSTTYCPQAFVHPRLSDAWPHKELFLSAVATIEAAICLGEPSEMQEEGFTDMHGVIPTASFIGMDGQSPSRMEDGYLVGSGEFSDVCDDGTRIGWPEGYAKHYIGTHDVLPTQRFYEYVAWRAAAAKEKQ